MKKASAILLGLFLLSSCSGIDAKKSKYAYPAFGEVSADGAQQKMCVEENSGMLRFSRKVMEDFCPKLKSSFELICLRFSHSTKDWYKACPGIDTPEKLECFSTVANGSGSGYASVEALSKCTTATNRRQVYCLSELAANSSIALLPEMVQDCLDKNASLPTDGRAL